METLGKTATFSVSNSHGAQKIGTASERYSTEIANWQKPLLNDNHWAKPCFTQFSTRIKIEVWLKVWWDPIILKKAAFCSKKETSFGKKCV